MKIFILNLVIQKFMFDCQDILRPIYQWDKRSSMLYTKRSNTFFVDAEVFLILGASTVTLER